MAQRAAHKKIVEAAAAVLAETNGAGNAAGDGDNNGAGEAPAEDVLRDHVGAVIDEVAQGPQNVEIGAPTEG